VVGQGLVMKVLVVEVQLEIKTQPAETLQEPNLREDFVTLVLILIAPKMEILYVEGILVTDKIIQELMDGLELVVMAILVGLGEDAAQQ